MSHTTIENFFHLVDLNAILIELLVGTDIGYLKGGKIVVYIREIRLRVIGWHRNSIAAFFIRRRKMFLMWDWNAVL